MNQRGPSGMIPVVITVDTEPDDAWTHHLNPSVANVQELRRLQKVLDNYGAKATCLVTSRVIQDDRALAVLCELVEAGGAEIGAHLHPWETPPFMESGDDVKYATYPHELPLDIFKKKLACLTETITQRIGKPTSYRAGRWGWAAEHISVLEALGYRVDTSVMPWADFRPNLGLPRAAQTSRCPPGGIDYRRSPLHPYRPDYADVTRAGQADLVEIPVSVAFTRVAPTFVTRGYGGWPELPKRILRKCGVLRPVWALPAVERRRGLLDMMATLLAEGAGIINIAFHSSELMLDGSPRSRTKPEVDEIFGRIEAALSALASHGSCEFVTLSEAARAYERVERAVAYAG